MRMIVRPMKIVFEQCLLFPNLFFSMYHCTFHSMCYFRPSLQRAAPLFPFFSFLNWNIPLSRFRLDFPSFFLLYFLILLFVLHSNLSILSLSPDFHLLWMQLLRFMEKYASESQTEVLLDGIRESLRNILLVMDAQEIYSITGEVCDICSF